MSEYRVCADPVRSFAEAFAEEMARIEHPRIALSGGCTPRPLYRLWAREYRTVLPWDRTHIFQVDERCVRTDSDASNWKLLHEALLWAIPEARAYRMEAERDGASTIVYPKELVEFAVGRPNIKALMVGQDRLFDARAENQANELSQLSRRREQIASQIEGIKSQRIAADSQLRLIGEELKDLKTLLDRGLTQAARVLALEREEARLAGSAGQLDASRAEAEGRITEIDIEILKLGSARREEASTQLRDLGYRELELAERRRSLIEQVSRLEIRAPVSGLVHALQVTTPRSVIRAADPVLYLVPQDRPFVIAAQISPINVDEVRIGQPVTLRFAAFDARTTPELFGQISRVSADALVDERSKVSYYRAEVMLDPGEIEKLGGLVLIPGMPVEVFIRTGERTPLAYLLKPLAEYFNRAFRES